MNENKNENSYVETENLANFSRNINIEVEYNSCHCSSSCIRNEIVNLKNKMELIEEKLNTILQKMDNNIIKNCDKMGHHIDFVNNVYDTVKVPLHYISNKVQKIIGVTNDHHHDVNVKTSLNKIEYVSSSSSNVNVSNCVNDGEYLFTESD